VLFFSTIATRNNAPAIKKRKVATAVGDNPSFKAILTTTNELPQKKINNNIKRAFK
jgi:hypothetical protein